MFSSTQSTILSTISNNERTLADIARQTGLTKPNLNTQLKLLEKDGWVIKREVSKKRIYFRALERNEFIERIADEQDRQLHAIFDNEPANGRKPLVVAGYNLYFSPEQLERIGGQFNFVEYPESEEAITAELFELRYANAEIAIVDTMSLRFWDKSQKAVNKNLKHVVCRGKFAKEYVDVEAFKELGIHFWDMSSPDMNFIRNTTTEFLVASVLNVLKPTQQAEQEIKLTGKNSLVVAPEYMEEELGGKTVGIIGVDNSAKFAAPVLHALGAKTLFADPDDKGSDPFDLGVERLSSVAELFAKADVVIYTDNYYKKTPELTSYINENMRTRYLLILGEYPYDPEFMRVCRKSLLSGKLRGLHLDYWSMRRFAETPNERSELLSEVMYLPNVRVTPFLGIKSLQSQLRLNDYTIDILKSIREQYYA